MKKITYALFGLIALAPSMVSAGFGETGLGSGYRMTGYHSGGMCVFMIAGGLVWTVVGVLAGVWLWQHISKK